MMNPYQALVNQASLAFLPDNEMIWSFMRKISIFGQSVLHFLSRNKIDTNPYPYTPEGLGINLHVGHGSLVWNKKNHSQRLLKPDVGITGYDFLRETRRIVVMNARALDWFIANPSQIPVEWKGKKILFLGTLYENFGSHKNLFVRGLDCTREGVSWAIFALNKELDENSYALLV